MASREEGFENLPDVVLILILKQLSLEDRINLSKTNKRLQVLSGERSIVKDCNFEGFYLAREEDVWKHISSHHEHIENLTFNHCHWLSATLMKSVIKKCKQLQQLHLIECKLKTDALVKLLVGLPKLRNLSLSIATFADIKRDKFDEAQTTLKNLTKLHLYYTSTEMVLMRFLGESSTILDYCHRLEELVIDSAGMAVPELYRPIISDPQLHSKLKAFSLTPNIHAGAQMFFYGTLQQLPNASIEWHTLLMPNVNFSEFSRKPEFRDCLKQIDKLEHLDLSGSKVDFPNSLIDLQQRHRLRYLNLKSTLHKDCQIGLKYILVHCPQLTSLNLAGWAWSRQGNKASMYDFGGLELIFEHCPNLQHLNICGEHQHFQNAGRLFDHFKGLRSLSFAVCLICCENPCYSRTSGKRIMRTAHPGSPGGMAPKKRLCNSGAVIEMPSVVPDQTEASTSSTTPSRASRTPHQVALSTLVAQSPQLKELEIIAVRFDSAVQRNKFVYPKLPQFQPCLETRLVRDMDLEPIGRLRHLEHLTLAGIPGLLSSHSLVTITQGCINLRYLSLAYFGGTSFTTTLCHALTYCQQLQDLRLEQPHMSLSGKLFEAIGQCPRLERLCVIAKHSVFQADDVLNMVNQCRRLVVIQLFGGGTITDNRKLCQAITKRYGETRAGLSVTMFPLLYEGISQVVTSIPAKHIEELTRFDSRVAIKPPR